MSNHDFLGLKKSGYPVKRILRFNGYAIYSAVSDRNGAFLFQANKGRSNSPVEYSADQVINWVQAQAA